MLWWKHSPDGSPSRRLVTLQSSMVILPKIEKDQSPESWGYPQMDGLFHGKSQTKVDDLGETSKWPNCSCSDEIPTNSTPMSSKIRGKSHQQYFDVSERNLHGMARPEKSDDITIWLGTVREEHPPDQSAASQTVASYGAWSWILCGPFIWGIPMIWWMTIPHMKNPW